MRRRKRIIDRKSRRRELIALICTGFIMFLIFVSSFIYLSPAIYYEVFGDPSWDFMGEKEAIDSIYIVVVDEKKEFSYHILRKIHEDSYEYLMEDISNLKLRRKLNNKDEKQSGYAILIKYRDKDIEVITESEPSQYIYKSNVGYVRYLEYNDKNLYFSDFISLIEDY